jgi:NADH-quinone oxidoreductase subunit H
VDWYVVAVNVIKAVVLIVGLLIGFAYGTYLERKVIAKMQARIGPNQAGPFGLLIPVADGIKLIFKENITPAAVEKSVYFLAPLISMVVAILAFAMIPVGDPIPAGTFGNAAPIPLQIADSNVALLYVLGISSLAVYGIVLAGWSSNNKYSLMGGLRSSAQMVSYELAMGLSLIGVVMLAGTLSLTEIVNQQRTTWFLLLQPLAFFLYGITALAETNRAPFDMPEAEQELVAGYHTEYTGMRFALFFMAEYINVVTVSAMAITLFLGGYHLPCVFGLCPPDLPWFLDMGVFVVKVIMGMFVFVWIRATIPRLRYDQLMGFGWKVLLPLAIVNLALTAVAIAVYQSYFQG